MRAILTVAVVLVLSTVAWSQSSNQRFNSIALGPSTGQPPAATGLIRMPNGGRVRSTTTTGQTYSLAGYDVDGTVLVDVVTITNGNTVELDLGNAVANVDITGATIDLVGTVTVNGEPLLPFEDPAADALFYYRNSDDSLQPVTIGSGLTFSSGTLSATLTPLHAVMYGAVGAFGAMGLAGLVWVTARVRVRVRQRAWA